MHNTVQRHDRYPGTRPFADSAVDQRVFFGRDHEIHELLHQVRTTNLLVLFGKSGVGKTSLLQAGLFPRLRTYDLLPLTVRLNDIEQSPRALFFEMIEEQCRGSGIEYIRGSTASLWEFFKTALFLHGESLQTPVLIFDQFEELFTLQDHARRTEIVRELADLTSSRLPEQIRAKRRAGETLPYSDRPPEVKIVLSLREDYLGALQELSSELPSILEQRFRLTEFGEAQARAAMEEPAKIADEHLFSTQAFGYEENVIQQVLTFLKGRTGIIEPFQLQILCQHVEQRVRLEQTKGQAHIRVDQTYLGDTRSMQAILENFYKNAVQKIVPRRQRNRARWLCEEGLLNRLGQRLSLEEQQIVATYKVSRETLNTLVDVRLLRKEPRLDSFYYEISHDSLAQPIARGRRFRIPKHVLYSGLAILAVMGLIGYMWDKTRLAQFNAELAQTNAELAQTNAELAQTNAELAQTKMERGLQARAEVESLLSFLVDDLQEKLRPIGKLDLIEGALKRVNEYFTRVEADEDNAEMLRLRLNSYTHQGNLLSTQGNLNGALRAYQDGLDRIKKLVEQEPRNTYWQMYSTWLHDRRGNVLVYQGQLAEAWQAYQRSLAIREELVAQAPIRWQPALAVSYDKVGDVLVHQGQLTEAWQAYQRSLAIREELVAQEPNNAGRRPDEAMSHDKIGDVLVRQGQVAEAWQAYQRGLAIRKELVALDPSNDGWQEGVAVSYENLGNVLVHQGQVIEALQAYQRGLAIREELVARNPSDAGWKQALAVSHDKIGDVLVRQGQLTEALQAYQRGLAIREELVARNPSDADWQIDLIVSFQEIRANLDVASEPGRQEAKEKLGHALLILRNLQEQGRLVPRYQDWIGTLEKRLEGLKTTQDQP
jgi:tetratricopeptide (TPR) repeat protein